GQLGMRIEPFEQLGEELGNARVPVHPDRIRGAGREGTHRLAWWSCFRPINGTEGLGSVSTTRPEIRARRTTRSASPTTEDAHLWRTRARRRDACGLLCFRGYRHSPATRRLSKTS